MTRAFPEGRPWVPSPTVGEPAQHNVAPSGIKATSRGLSRKELFAGALKERLAAPIASWRDRPGMALCPRIQRQSRPRAGLALGAARRGRVVSAEAARRARGVSEETARRPRVVSAEAARPADGLAKRPLGERERLAPRPLGLRAAQRRGSAEAACPEADPRAASSRRRRPWPGAARGEARRRPESARESRPAQDLAGAFHEPLTNGPGWRRKPVRFRYCGEVAKWLGNGLQNRYTRVRIPSSPPHPFSERPPLSRPSRSLPRASSQFSAAKAVTPFRFPPF